MTLPLTLLACCLYVMLATLFWHRVHTATTATPWVGGHALLALPLALHGWLVFSRLLGHGSIDLGVGIALSLIIWLAVLLFWTASFFQRLVGLEPPVLLLAAVSMLPELFWSAPRLTTHFDNPWFRLHLLVAFGSQALCTLAALLAGLILLVDRQLHRHNANTYWQRMPPLLVLERWMFGLLWAGFLLLSITLLSGGLFSEVLFQQPFRFNHKTVLGVLAWLTFGALLWRRWRSGLRGRSAARLMLSGFSLLVLAYLGSRLVLSLLGK